MGWTIGNYYLSEIQMQGNVLEVYLFLSARGWTTNAIAAMCGNMQSESHINPGIWQDLIEWNYSGGFGLVQWTPATNYTEWALSYGYSITDPTGQLVWIDTITASVGQWRESIGYPFSWDGFRTSTEDPEYLASAFLYNFERPDCPETTEADRRSQAHRWYDFLNQYADGGQKIEDAVRWAVNIADDDSHGYDQTNRWGPDYDCSSLLIQAWENAGVPVKSNGAVTTRNMYDVFTACGFQDVTSEVSMAAGTGVQRGDILLNHENHTAMSIGNGQVVQASQNEFGGVRGGEPGDQTGQEIWITGYYNYPWNCILRYPGGGSVPQGVYIVRWIPA